MRKELEISAKFDTSDFDKAVERMQKRLKEIYAPADMVRAQTATNQRLQGMGMQAGPYGQAMGSSSGYRATTQQERRELDQMIQKQIQGQERLAKQIVHRDELVKRLEARQSKMIEGSKEELRIREQLSKIEERQFRLRENYAQRDQTMQQMMDARERTKQASGFSGEGFDLMRRFAGQGMYGAAGRQFGRMFSHDPMGYGGAGMLTGAAVGAGAIRFGQHMSGYPMRLEEARGTAVGQTTGRDLASVYGGRSPFEAAWMPERENASGIAKEKSEFTKKLNLGKLAVAGLMIAGGAALVIGTGGAALPAIPALGLSAGAATTAAGGSAIIGGLGAIGFSDQLRERVLGMAPGEFGDRHKKQYEQLIASQQAQDFRSVLENIKDQDPKKKEALEKYERERMRDVSAQRALGLSDFGYYGGGGFLNMAHRGGFMSDQAIGMASNIVGAGGSARMGRQAGFGLGMERAGLTNAGGILGSLSGSIQSPEATKRATISIMAEAFQTGLDNTEFAEENRRFTQAAANIIGRSGASATTDQDRIARTLGMFLGERSNRGVEAAQGAYERFQQRGAQLGGRRGAMRLSSAMKDPILSKFSTQDLTELLGARPDQLRTDSAFLQSYAVEAGTTPEEILKAVGKVNQQSRFLIPGRAKEVERMSANVNKYMQDNKLTYSQLVEKSRKGELPANIQKDFGTIQRRISQEESGGYETAGVEAQAGEFLTGGAGAAIEPSNKKAAQDLIEGVGTRLADKFQAKGAEGEDEARKGFRAMSDELDDAVAATTSFTQAISGAARALHEEQGSRRSELPRGNATGSDIINTILNANSPEQRMSVQPQATKDSR
jgi:hypothetical protein